MSKISIRHFNCFSPNKTSREERQRQPSTPSAEPGKQASGGMRHDTNRRHLLLKGAVTDKKITPYQSPPASHRVASEPETSGINFENKETPVSAALNGSIKKFLKEAAPRLARWRSKDLINAEKMLRPLADKTTLTQKDILTLMDANSCVEKLAETNPSKRLGASNLADQINQFIGSGTELRQGLHELSSRLEHNAETMSFESYLQKNHPTMITNGPRPGEVRLTAEGAKHYSQLKQIFDASTTKHVISTNDRNMSEGGRALKKIIDNTCEHYQKALRTPDNSMETRRQLIECSEIIKHLAKATPEAVEKERFASVFPGGISDPSQLEKGKVYKEDGFLFAGGERTADAGFNMTIKLTKGYQVDARQYYGHSTQSDEKLQWITLPGAQFQFDGTANENGQTTYMFSQISR